MWDVSSPKNVFGLLVFLRRKITRFPDLNVVVNCRLLFVLSIHELDQMTPKCVLSMCIARVDEKQTHNA